MTTQASGKIRVVATSRSLRPTSKSDRDPCATIENVIRIRRTTSGDPDFVILVDKLNGFLAEINGDKHEFYSQYNRTESLQHVLVAYIGYQPVGCGALRLIEDSGVEIKRMFVAPDSRRQGTAQAILKGLEDWACELGQMHAVLETSKRLDAARHLYQESGYEVIPNYGPYVDAEDSICMRKSLG